MPNMEDFDPAMIRLPAVEDHIGSMRKRSDIWMNIRSLAPHEWNECQQQTVLTNCRHKSQCSLRVVGSDPYSDPPQVALGGVGIVNLASQGVLLVAMASM